MAEFTILEKISGPLKVLKSEAFDVQFSRYKTAPRINLKGSVILITGATSGKPHLFVR